MKGMMLPFVTTLVLMIIAVVLILGGIVIYGIAKITGSNFENRFDFISLVERPYDASILLSENNINERPFLERSLETSLSEKKEDEFLDVPYMLDGYDFESWYFMITTDENLMTDNQVYSTDNVNVPCGSDDNSDGDPDGVCVSNAGIENENAGDCGVGRIEISAMCGYGFVCCEEDAIAYMALPKHFEPITCGEEDNGFCTSKLQYAFAGGGTVISCGAGRIYYETGDEDCVGANDDKTPVCCIPADLKIKKKLGIVSSAKTPLLYKGETLYEPKNYECRDAIADKCDGEFIRDHCPNQPTNIQCCVTDIIHCEPPHDDFVCMDMNHCDGEGKIPVEGPEGEKLCPGGYNYICCSTEDAITGEPPTLQSYGECTLDYHAYSGKPFTGFLHLTIGGPLVIK